ncbi:hypothetical protein M3Y99_00970000 [Aphelenchoides fujianensis]|nr:hypothetical protein M3Y99_00970000 [Aphelenchoides fujianensis]
MDGSQRAQWSCAAARGNEEADGKDVVFFSHTHIDLERIFQFAASQLVSKTTQSTPLPVHQCKASILDVQDGRMSVHLCGDRRADWRPIGRPSPTSPSFSLHSSFPGTWKQTTSASNRSASCPLAIRNSCRSTPCLRNSQTVRFHDVMTFHDSVLELGVHSRIGLLLRRDLSALVID